MTTRGQPAGAQQAQRQPGQVPPKPLPRPTMNPELTKPFWDATKRHELVIPYCLNHGGFFFYPREVCPICWSNKFEYVKVSGRGRLHSWTTVYQPAHPGFGPEAPIVHALIELEEGARIIGRLVGIDPNDYLSPKNVNQPVVAVFEDVSPEWTLVHWRPA